VVVQNAPSGQTASLPTRPCIQTRIEAIQNEVRKAVLKRERLDLGPMTETRRKSDVAADRTGNVWTNGEIADLPRASKNRWR